MRDNLMLNDIYINESRYFIHLNLLPLSLSLCCVDSAVYLSILCNRLLKEGAKRVFVCASHGSFTKQSIEIIDLSPISKVVITDSIALPTQPQSNKIVQVSIAPLLAKVIRSDMSLAEFNKDSADEDPYEFE